jgi:hypothetical protein
MPSAKSLTTWASIGAFGVVAVGQSSITSLDAAICNGALSTFSACNGLYSTIQYCAGPDVATGAPFISCYCNQQLYDQIFEYGSFPNYQVRSNTDMRSCGSEQRLCYGNNMFDGQMNALASNWNSACDRVITFTPTTPAASTLSASYDQQYCTTAASACQDQDNALQSCSISYLGKDTAKFSSCFCDPPVLSAAFTCGYLGNVSCAAAPATLSNFVQYTACDNFASLFSDDAQAATAAPSTTAASSSSAGTASESSAAITSPPLPGSMSGGSQATSTAATTSNSGAGMVVIPNWLTLAYAALSACLTAAWL